MVRLLVIQWKVFTKEVLHHFSIQIARIFDCVDISCENSGIKSFFKNILVFLDQTSYKSL